MVMNDWSPAEESERFILDQEFLRDDPAQAYSHLREHCPVFAGRHPAPHAVAAGARTIREILADIPTWTSRFGVGFAYEDPDSPTNAIVATDPPKHTLERLAVGRFFRRSVVADMEDDIRKLVRETIARLAPRGRADAVRDLAVPVPLTVMCWLFGTPTDDIPRLHEWTLPIADGVTAVGEPGEELEKAARAFRAYFSDLISRRRGDIAAGRPVPDDLLTQMITFHRQGWAVTDAQLLGFCRFLLAAGSLTTTILIGNMIHILLERPDLTAQLRSDHALVEAAVEECLRLEPPVRGLFRTSSCPVTLEGVDIDEHVKMLMLFGAGNRDPEVWERPDEFDITRNLADTRRNTLTFGSGVHFCLGAWLARLEARVVIEEVLTTLPNVRRGGEATLARAAVLGGYEEVPVAWDPVETAP
jgi:cytochrome P450